MHEKCLPCRKCSTKISYFFAAAAAMVINVASRPLPSNKVTMSLIRWLLGT